MQTVKQQWVSWAALVWFAMPWLGSLFRTLYPLSAQPHRDATFAPAATAALILDASRRMGAWPVRNKPADPGSRIDPSRADRLGPRTCIVRRNQRRGCMAPGPRSARFRTPLRRSFGYRNSLGVLVRSLWQPSEVWRAGVALSGKTLLEIAVTLLGASISFATIVASGPTLLAGIAITVVAALAVSYTTSRALGLPQAAARFAAIRRSPRSRQSLARIATMSRPRSLLQQSSASLSCLHCRCSSPCSGFPKPNMGCWRD